LKKITAGALRESLRNWFPEREFFMRSQGQVRFITITSRMQIAAASLVVAVIGGWVCRWVRWQSGSTNPRPRAGRLLEREADVATAESRVAAYRDDLGNVTRSLDRRQNSSRK
jgi:hypothetical protein